jgi:hypothetical protein
MKFLPSSVCKQCQKHHDKGHQTLCESDTAAALIKAQEEIAALTFQLHNQVPIVQYIPMTNLYGPGLYDELKQKPSGPAEKSTDLIVGYRIWHYKDGYLTSAYKTDVKWPHRKQLTRDVYNNEGIHAVKDYKKCIPLLKYYCIGDEPSVYNPMGSLKTGIIGVAGAVYMWGEVKEHEIGYLSEFAYPKELYVGDDFDPISAMQLEENYGVSVQLREELRKENLKNSSSDWFPNGLVSWSSNFYAFPSTVVNNKISGTATVIGSSLLGKI